ncbi:unnamed protein product [Brassica rapa subsp. trilocularis]
MMQRTREEPKSITKPYTSFFFVFVGITFMSLMVYLYKHN